MRWIAGVLCLGFALGPSWGATQRTATEPELSPLSTQAVQRRPVSALAVSPTGTTLASGSWDHTVVLWDLAGRTVRRRLVGHTNWVTALAWAPDSARLASGGRDGMVRLWDRATGRLLKKFRGDAIGVNGLAFAPRRRQLAAVGFDGRVRMWEPNTGATIHNLKLSSSGLRTLAYSPDGKTLAVGGDGGRIWIVDVATGRLRHRLRAGNLMVSCVAFIRSGRELIGLARDGALRRWRARDGKLLEVSNGKSGEYVEDVFGSLATVRQDADILATADGRGINLWDLGGRIFISELGKDLPGDIYSLAFASPQKLLVGLTDGSIYEIVFPERG